MTPVLRQGPEALGALEWVTAEDSEAGVRGQGQSQGRRQARGRGTRGGKPEDRVDPHHQAGPTVQGYEDRVPGGDLSLLPAIKILRSLIFFSWGHPSRTRF